MTVRPKLLASALAAAALAALAGGCGSSVPSADVASVGGNPITKGDFSHWYLTAAKQQAQQSGASAGSVTAPDPPSFKECIASKQLQPVPPGTPKPSVASLKSQCKQQYQTLMSSVMQFLITAQWLTSEAAHRGINLSQAAVVQSFLQQKAQAFPHDKNDANFQRYLAQTGQTQADILLRVKLQLIQTRIQAQVSRSAPPVSSKDIASYYAKNKQRFSQPESRDLLVVLTSKPQQAQAALAALRSGQPWPAVAKKYSIDNATKAAGGRLPSVTRGQQEQAFDQAIFGAPLGVLEGPVKTQFGYYVFKVTKINPASQQSLAQATPTISSLLRSQHQQTALSDFIKGFQQRYTDLTVCAKDYSVPQLCSNALTKSQPVSGATPQAPCGVPCGTKPASRQQAALPQGLVPQGGTGAPGVQGAPPQTGP